MKIYHLTAVCVSLVLQAAAAPAIDLAGEWRFALDPQDKILHDKPSDWSFPDRIRLPGMVTAQGFGAKPSLETQWTGDGWRYPELFREWQTAENFKMPFFLQPPLHYIGPAWFQREIEIPADWGGDSAVLHLERVHWTSTVWVDGQEIGKGDSLGTPHEHDAGVLPACRAGKCGAL